MKILFVIATVLAALAMAYFLLKKPSLIDKSEQTYSGRAADYRGEKKLIVAFTASWASVWILTKDELKKLDRTKFDVLILDQACDGEEISNFGISFLPTVALVEHGKIIKSVQNLTDINQVADW